MYMNTETLHNGTSFVESLFEEFGMYCEEAQPNATCPESLFFLHFSSPHLPGLVNYKFRPCTTHFGSSAVSIFCMIV